MDLMNDYIHDTMTDLSKMYIHNSMKHEPYKKKKLLPATTLVRFDVKTQKVSLMYIPNEIYDMLIN